VTDDRWNRNTAPVSADAIVPAQQSAFDPARERYEVGEELGRGGMGRVVAARDTTLDREVAIKQALDDDSTNLARFEREVRITARLEHPSIVPVHDAGRDQQGRPYYIMRRIDGEPLAELVAKGAMLRDRIALVPNVLAACDAAAFAHARRVIHRDIKPANILIGRYGETLLIDWGLARALDEDDKLRGGTEGYMPPEQARGERTDARGDVYALGATLHHVLAGKRDVPLPDEVPKELVTITAKATARDPAARYADAGGLAADLRAFLAGQLVSSHAYSPWERLRRWVRRHRIAVATAVIATLALVVVGVVAIVNVVRERDAAAAARAVAADRAEVMLLERASTLASRDPTRAVALLAELAAGSRYLPRARDIAAIAAAHGIAHGKLAHRGEVKAIALAPTGNQLVTGGTDGTLQLHDLVGGTSKTLATGAPVMMAAWTGGSITYGTEAAIERVQLATGTHEVLVPGVSFFWTVGDRVRFQRDGLLVERAANEVVLARDVVDAIGLGELAVIEGGGKLRVVDRSGERVLASGTVGAMAISPDGVLIAASIDDDVVEWEVATGAERGRWPKLGTYFLVYSGQHLYHRPTGQMGGLDRLVRGSSIETVRGTSSLMLHADTAAGTVLVGNDGTFVVLENTRAHRFALDPLAIRSIASQPGSTIFAIGMNDGSVRWWDAAQFMPAVVDLPNGTLACSFDATNVYALEGTDLFAVARKDGVARAIGSGMYRDCRVAPGGVIGIHMPEVPGMTPMDLVDAMTGKATPLPGNAICDATRGTLAFTPDGKAIVEQAANGTRITRATAPATATFLSVESGWIAVALDDKRALRIDPQGRTEVIEVGAPVDAVTMTSSGVMWIASGHDLLRYAGSLTKVATVTSDIVEIGPVGDADAALLLRDASIWHVTTRGIALRAEPASGARPTSLGGVRTAATVESGHTLTVLYLHTGERIARRAPDLVWRVHVSKDDREVLAQLTNPPLAALIYREVVPAAPAALRAWLARATNAVVAADSDALTWR
jgi:Protein kinase domain/WD domain, G-beta repeat